MRGFLSFQIKFLHGCIQKYINVRKENLTVNQTTEQADSSPLRYVAVMSHACILFVLLVL